MTIAQEGKMIKRGRSKDWNEGLSEDLQDREFAREFLLAAVEEDISIQAALGKVIRAYGLKEFAAEIDMPSSNLSRALRPSSNVTQQTLNRLLKPFGLRLSIALTHDDLRVAG
jgi:DNA-binding phage protein